MAEYAKRWTWEELRIVSQLALKGWSAANIAKELVGRTRNSVIGVCSRQGIKLLANQNVTVRSKDVNLVNSLSNGIGTLLQTGVNINNYGPQFYVSNLATLRPALLAQAMVDAKERGISMTKAVGSKLGSVIAVSSGPVQVTSPDSVDTSGGGLYDTTTIPKTVTVTVSVSFKVN